MTIDERIERLTERHEALAQSVEMLTRDVREMQREMQTRFSETLQFINRLAHIAEAHEQRP